MVLRHDERAVDGYQNHRGVHDLGLHLYMYVVRGMVLRHDGSDLALHHRGERAVHELVLRRCTCVAHELVDRLHNDRENHVYLMAFRHPYAVVFQRDSKHHYFAWRPELRRAEIQRGYAHLGREVPEVREIQPLQPWILAWRVSWQQ
jgi:hypothetical protein